VFVKYFLLLIDTVILLYGGQFLLLYMQSSYTKILHAIQKWWLGAKQVTGGRAEKQSRGSESALKAIRGR